MDKLSPSYKVVLFDNRGMGYSTAPPGNFSIEEMADDVAGFLDALEIEEAHVLGWSMGSLVAQEVALRHPENMNKLVLYASNCGGAEVVQPAPEILEELTNTSGYPRIGRDAALRPPIPARVFEGKPGVLQLQGVSDADGAVPPREHGTPG